MSLASHTASSLSVFGRPGTFFTSRALTSCTSQPGRLQQVEPDPPVVRCGFHGDLLDPQLDQLIGQVADRAGAWPARPTPC